MTTAAIDGAAAGCTARRGDLRIDNRYLAPVLITCILLAGQITLRLPRELVADAAGDRDRASSWS